MEANAYVVTEIAAVSAVRGLLGLAPLFAVTFLNRKLGFGLAWQVAPLVVFALLAAAAGYDLPILVSRSSATLNQVAAAVSRIVSFDAGLTTSLFVIILAIAVALRKKVVHG